MHTTCVATRLNAGHANNALPQTAQANVNCRIVPGHSTEEIRQELEKVVADPKISVNEVGGIGGVTNRKSFAPPPLRPDVFQPLEKVVESMWPGLPVIPDMATGASDGVYTNAAGMPTYCVSAKPSIATTSAPTARMNASEWKPFIARWIFITSS